MEDNDIMCNIYMERNGILNIISKYCLRRNTLSSHKGNNDIKYNICKDNINNSSKDNTLVHIFFLGIILMLNSELP